MFRSPACPSKLVQVELAITLEVLRAEAPVAITCSALAWVPRTPRPYIGMPRQIADRRWWVTRIPDQAKRGTLSPLTVAVPEPIVVVSDPERDRRKAIYAARGRKGWATRKRMAAS